MGTRWWSTSWLDECACSDALRHDSARAGSLTTGLNGMVFAGTTMWDPTGRRRVYFSWIGANNTHAFPREVLVRGSTILFRPIGEALNLRRPNASVAAAYSLRAPQLALNVVPLPPGLQQIDIEAELRRRGTRQGSHFVPPAVRPEDRPVPDDLTPQAIRNQIETRGRLPVLKMQE